ncbi:IS5 family transposase [Streptomyces antibioticus]|uniref:IS5 family transposase n=1 Tax=Streptomyces antibioticus TaxID=1890 RepID=UPI0033FB29E1
MSVVPACILEPLREEFLAQLPDHRDDHPLGCHNPRIPDALVFDRLILVLVSGMGYERVADQACSATTIRRRRDHWITLGMGEALRLAALAAYDRMVGLELEHLAADGCQTKAPSGGECAGKSPVDRAKQGVKRSQLTEAYGIPLVTDPAPANIRDHTLLPGTLDQYRDLGKVLGPLPEQPALSLDAGYDYRCVYEDLTERQITAQIAKRGQQTPIQADGRWVVERTNSWLNNFGKLRRCTERRRVCVEFYIALAAAVVTIRSLIRRAWFTYRWDTRPRSPRIR